MNYAELPDAEIVRLCATQVMGWAFVKPKSKGPGTHDMLAFAPPDTCNQMWWPGCSGGDGRSWNPLASDADAFMLVDAVMALPVDEGWEILFEIEGTEGDWTVDFGLHSAVVNEGGGVGRRRAICIAALRATAEEAPNA